MNIIKRIAVYSLSLAIAISGLTVTFSNPGSVYGDEFDGDIIPNPFTDAFTTEQSTESSTNNTMPITDIKVGEAFTARSIGYRFEIRYATKTATLLKSTKSKRTTAVIPSKIKYKGKTYKVTAIDDKAFINHKKLKTVTIGKYITKIGSRSFYGCKSLKKLTIKSKKIKKIGSNAFKKTSKKIKIYVPKSKFKKYKKLLKKKGISKKAKFNKS